MTAFTDEGARNGTPLLLLHSIGTNATLWDAVARAFAGTRRIIRVDFRGHGRTPPTQGPYTLDLLAADALGILDELGVPRADVAGVSLGGMVAQALAAAAPARVRSITLVATALAIPPETLWRERAALVRAHGMGPMVQAGTALARWVTANAPEPVRDRLRAMLVATAPEGYAGAAEAIAAANLSASTATLRVPTLVIVGDADIATPPVMAEALRDAILGARLHIIPGAAHLPMAEHPDEVFAAMAGFLDQVG